MQIIHTRSRELNRSSMLPPTTVVGIADRIPLMNRPMITPAIDGTEATTTHARLYSAELTTYSFFRPNASEYGGKMIPPHA